MMKDMLLATMGSRIKALRKKKNLSQLSIAQHLGVSVSAVSLWEKDKANITSDKLTTLAQILDCEVDWLLQGDEKKDKNIENLITNEYRGELLNVCKAEIMKASPQTVEDAVHIFQIATDLEEPYIQTLLKTAMDLHGQQLWSRIPEKDRGEIYNNLKNKYK